jgi:hypothetical protein
MKKNPKEYLKELVGCVLPKHKKMIECYRLDGEKNLNDDILTNIYNNIDKERNKLVSQFRSFYSTKGNDISPEETFELIFKLVLQIKRLVLVYKPSSYKSLSSNKANGKRKYKMYKLLWLNDDAKIYRIATRTFGRVGNEGLKKSLPKILEKYFGDDLREYEIYLNSKVLNNEIVDFTAIINGVTWLFNFDKINQDDFCETAIRLELWELYKKTYKLI